ncbi:MAG: 2'-5' RNA ligase family protein [Pseudomonadota bacterium]
MPERAILLFPNGKQLDTIQEIRRKYDPLAELVPPHITLVFPFQSDISTSDLESHLKASAKDINRFTAAFQKANVVGSEYVFLSVDQGVDIITDLHDRLYTSVLAPYLKREIPYQPHLTLGRTTNKETLVRACNEANQKVHSLELEVTSIIIERIAADQSSQTEVEFLLGEA